MPNGDLNYQQVTKLLAEPRFSLLVAAVAVTCCGYVPWTLEILLAYSWLKVAVAIKLPVDWLRGG